MTAKEITFHPHFVKRWKTRELDIDKVEDTVKTGKVFEKINCKRGFRKYYGKENESYIVYVLVEKDFIEIQTAWKVKGR